MPTKPRWIALLGRFEFEQESLVFKGGTITSKDGQPTSEVGNFISDQYFGGGQISATIEFRGERQPSAAGLILHYHPLLAGFVEAQLGGLSLCSVRTWHGQEWTIHASRGPSEQIKPHRPYEFEIRSTGSRISLLLDGVRVLETNLPFSLPHGQAGIWAMGTEDIAFSRFTVLPEKPKLFVIMQFTNPFNELYSDVVVPVGTEAGFSVIRADETYGPGLIIADIERQIFEAKAIVADITPNNPNVYWEVGYAHAVRKPTILIAERDTRLPFDVSPFRTLFYDNTIAGKARIEDGLRKHLAAIQTQWSAG